MIAHQIRAKAKQGAHFVWARRWSALTLSLLVAAAVLAAPRYILGPKVAVDVVVRRELVQTVVASGHVEAPYRAEIGSQITGIVADVPVAEGQFVHVGDALVILDDKDLRAAVDQAQSAVATAQARLRQIDEVIRPAAAQSSIQAEANLRNAQQSYDRTAKLIEGGYSTRAQLDEARRALDVAQAQARSARLTLATNQPGGSDYVLAQHALTLAEANFRSAQIRLTYAVARAPRDGTLITRNVERGDIVQPGKVLMTLSPAGETQLVVQIDEKNLSLLAVGQRALASADAFPNRTFPAELFYISPGIDLQRASVEAKLRVAPADVPDYLRQDMTVSVDVEVARRPNAIVLPVQAVHDATRSSPWVLKVEQGRAAKRPVTLGIRGATHVEVLSGVEPGDMIIPWTETANDGQRVRPVPHE